MADLQFIKSMPETFCCAGWLILSDIPPEKLLAQYVFCIFCFCLFLYFHTFFVARSGGDPPGLCSSGIPQACWSISPDLGKCAAAHRKGAMKISKTGFLKRTHFRFFFAKDNLGMQFAQFREMIVIVVMLPPLRCWLRTEQLRKIRAWHCTQVLLGLFDIWCNAVRLWGLTVSISCSQN